MTPYEIRLELLKLAFEILRAKQVKPELMPSTEEVVKEAETLNMFISTK